MPSLFPASFVRVCAALAIAGFFGAASARAASAPETFKVLCASCHGKDGKGKTPIGRKLGARDLTELKIPEAEIERQIRDGSKPKDGVVKMPSFKDKLSEEEIKGLVEFVKTFRKS